MNKETLEYRLDGLQKIHNKLVIEHDKLKNRLRHADSDLERFKKENDQLKAIVATLWVHEKSTTLKSDCWQMANKYFNK